ncbi:MAG: PEGA domain-containing protein [Sandaracinaceae bacterium]
MRHLSVALVVLALTPLPVAAQADVQDVLTSAVAEYEAGNYGEAYALFLRAHELNPSARSARALGKASFELRRYIECITWLETALTDPRSPLTEEMRAEVEELLGRARAFVGRFAVHTNVDTALVEADGAPLAGSTLQLDLGEHEIVARAAGYEPVTRRITVRGGEDLTLELTLIVADRPGARMNVGPDPGAVYRDLAWASVVAGGVLVVGGAIATGLWASAVGALNANIDAGVCVADPSSDDILAPSPPTCFDQENRYRLTLPFVYVGFLGGGALLATGLGLALFAPSGDDAGAVACGTFATLGAQCRVTF